MNLTGCRIWATPPSLQHRELERVQYTQTHTRTTAFTQIGQTGKHHGDRAIKDCTLGREGEH